jgi:hypothetical protein
MPLPNALQAVPPLVRAAVLLVARTLLVSMGLPCPSVAAILAATGATRSRAYELSSVLIALLPTLARPPGRPATTLPAQRADDDSAVLTREVLGYVMRHPGCVDRGHERQRYSDGFRRFVLEQRGKWADMALEHVALATDVPLGTLKDWLRVPSLTGPAIEACEPVFAEASGGSDSVHVQTVLDAWRRWDGSFVDFCEHTKRDLLVPFGRDLVRRILAAHGERQAARRKGHSVGSHISP